jgi:MFS transporter, SP family, solute carrier family 2 (myo-inositol transporter), member 13
MAPTIPILMIGRVIVGLGVGVASMIVPVYISEVTPTELRGKMVAVNVFTITAGQLIASGIAFALGEKWRLMLGIAAIPSFIQLICMFFMPESPRWLGKIGRMDEARTILGRIYTQEAFELKCTELISEIDLLKVET